MAKENDIFELNVWLAELESDHVKGILQMLRNYCDIEPTRPNLLIVRKNTFTNLPMAAKLFGMRIIEVDGLRACRNGHVSEEILWAFARELNQEDLKKRPDYNSPEYKNLVKRAMAQKCPLCKAPLFYYWTEHLFVCSNCNFDKEASD